MVDNATTELNNSASQATHGPAKSIAIEAFNAGRAGLSLVEARAREQLTSEASELSEISSYLLDQGGKRIRPLLAVLSARLFAQAEPSPALIDVAAGIELIHMATLLHDDIIDKSPTRRRKRSAYYEYGLAPSLLTGDFLLVRAFGLCAKLDDYVVSRTEEACVFLTEGEILEGTLSADTPKSFDEYLTIVGKKTASLFSLAAELGAYLSGADKHSIARLKSFGYNAGIAFQMVDDILDITADEDLLGKPAGTDLRQKTPSLVNILWLESGDKDARRFFSKPGISEREARAARDELKLSPTMTRSRALAREYADNAVKELAKLDASRIDDSTCRQLLGLVEYTLERCL